MMPTDPNLAANDADHSATDQRVEALLREMTLDEKIGQMCQVNAPEGHLPADFLEALRAGSIGSVLNSVDVNVNNELQRIVMDA